MPKRLFDEVKNWFHGVITSAPADQLPEGAIPRGYNTTLSQIGIQTALMSTRRGALVLNQTAITGSPGIIGGFQFKKKSGTKVTLMLGDNGRLEQLNPDNSLTNIVTTFTSGTHYPIFAVANDLCFIVNDVDQKKYDGSSVTKFGITKPIAPSASAAAGGAMALGIWEVALTYYNSSTGHESSLGASTLVALTGGNQKISVSWSAPSDAQVTHVRVYVRQQSAGANFYLAVAGATPAPDATNLGYIPATTATTLDISAVQYASFIIIGPGAFENEPPPVGTQGPTFHNQRLFLFDSGNVYYSNIKNNTPYPEAFNTDNVQPINPNDGDTIVATASFADKLYIFKKFSIYTITGPDPSSWVVDRLTKDFGGSTMRSIISAGGKLYWWAGSLGPCRLGPGSLPESLGKTLLASSISSDVLNHQGFASVHVGLDEQNQTILWAVPEFGATRNTRIIPFNYQAERFSAELWNPFDVYSLWSMETSDQLKALYIGNYGGQAFQWWAADADGIPGATTAKGSVTSSTPTTLTSSGATFATTGAGLKERYVYVISQDRLTIQRRRITANTGTQLTVTPAWDTAPNTTYTFVVGAIDFQLDTPWVTAGAAFLKKRFEFLLIEALSLDINVSLDVDIFTSMNLTEPKRTKSLPLVASGDVYDSATALYDLTRFAGSSITFGKLRVGATGRTWRVRIRHCDVNQNILIYRVSMQSVSMGIKR